MTWEQILIPALAAAGGWLVRHWQAQRGSAITLPSLSPATGAAHPLATEIGAVVRRELDVFLLQLIRSAAPAPAGGTAAANPAAPAKGQS